MCKDNRLLPVGAYLPLGEDQEEKYFADGERFCDEAGNTLSEEQMQEWALWLNSPWSFAHFHYDVCYNCKDAYSRPDEKLKWRCELTVIGYDGITATLIAYGDTSNDALSNCVKLFDRLQKKYNPEDKSV